MGLFVIGSSNTDLVIYLDHIPKIGETVIGGESSVIFGGKGANQAVAAKRAGANINFITQLGDDGFGEGMKRHFMTEELPQRYVLTASDPSGTGISAMTPLIILSSAFANSIAQQHSSSGGALKHCT